MNQTKLFLFFFVALKYDEQQEQKYAETKLETKRNSFYGFSVYDEKQMQTNMNDARIE